LDVLQDFFCYVSKRLTNPASANKVIRD
jgi:hypothetical protein